MKISKEIKTALLVIGSLALLIWGFFFLNGKKIFSTAPTYYVTYDNVDGLNTASPVTINGLVVGKVSSIELQKGGKLLVELTLNKPVELTKSTKAVLASSGLISGKQVILDVNYKDATPAPDGSFLLPGFRSGLIDGLGEKADPVIQKLDDLMESINNLTKSLHATLNDETKNNLQSAIASLEQTMKNANSITSKLDKITANNEAKINSILQNFEKTSGNLTAFTNDLDKVEVDKIQTSIENFNQSTAKLNQIVSDIDNGKGNMGKLLKNEDLYNNIEATTKELNQLIEDVKLNPSRYLNISVFSKKEPYKAPTK